MSKHNGVDADTLIHALNQWYIDLLDDLEKGSDLEVGVRDQLRNSIKLVRELEIKAAAYDELTKLEDEWADECMDYIDSLNESGGEIDESVLKNFDNEFAYERAMLSDRVYLSLKELKKKEG